MKNVLRTGHTFRVSTFASLTVALSLSGCSSLLGGGSNNHAAIYAPEVRAIDTQAWPQASWRLAISRTTGVRNAESQRIVVRPEPNELQVYKGAQWAKPPGEMLEEGVLHALEDSGRIAVVARQSAGVGSDYRLMLDVRRFESDYNGAAVPSATIEVTAKLLHVKDQQLAGSHTFLEVQAARSPDIPTVMDAFQEAMTKSTSKIAEWTLRTGEAHDHSAH